MSLSFASITPGNFDLGPCRVTYKGVDLGATVKNVVLKIEQDMAELKSDQLGSTPIDKRDSGFKVTVETELAEILNKDNWKVVFPFHKEVTSGGNKMFYFDATIGSSALSVAGALILHPLDKADNDLSGDVKIFLATAQGKAEYHFGPSEQASLKVTWDMYPDFTTTPARFMIYGDPSVGLVAASAGAAVAATGNTGNGTVGSISVFSGVTKTETITLTCVTAPSKFFVSGSQSGALGLATVGVGFVSPEIDFTITQGGTTFVVNDSFTIATTAANYS